LPCDVVAIVLLGDCSSDSHGCKQFPAGTWETAVARYAAQMAGQRQDEMGSVAQRQGRHTAHGTHPPVRSRQLVEVGVGVGSEAGGQLACTMQLQRTVHAEMGRVGRARRGHGGMGLHLVSDWVVSRVSRVAWRESEMAEDWTRRSDELWEVHTADRSM
jgi:hypothetical protein